MITWTKFSSPTGRITPGLVSAVVSRATFGERITSRTSQVLDIEGDQLRLAFDGSVHCGLVEPGLFRLASDLDPGRLHGLARLDVDASDVRSLSGKDLSLLAGFQKGGGREHGAGVAALRDKLLQIGIRTFDQLRDKLAVLGAENDLTAPRGHDHVDRLLTIGGDAR
jgi:hypothetical protein